LVLSLLITKRNYSWRQSNYDQNAAIGSETNSLTQFKLSPHPPLCSHEFSLKAPTTSAGTFRRR
jgi:hypothetical protein